MLESLAVVNIFHSSRRAIAKLVQVFDHLMQRNGKMSELIVSCPTSDDATNEGDCFGLIKLTAFKYKLANGRKLIALFVVCCVQATVFSFLH